MKRRLGVLLFAGLLLAATALPACAAATIEHEVDLDYWMSDLKSGGNDGDQNFFPSLDFKFGLNEGWSIVGRYAMSDKDTIGGTQVESDLYHIGARYDVPRCGAYATLGFHNYELDMGSGATATSIDADGLRLGVGYDFSIPMSDWDAGVDLGYGISNDYTVSPAGTTGDVDVFDYRINFSYAFALGVKGNVGWRYVNLKAKAPTGNTTLKYQGPYIGVGWKFD